MKQRIRPLLLLKKQQVYQRVGANTYAVGNALVDRGFRATALQATVASNDVVIFFTEDVIVTDLASGVEITINGTPATFTAVKGDKRVTYTLTSQGPVDYDDLVVWAYDSVAAGLDPYTGQESGIELSDTVLQRQMPSQILAPTWDTVVLPTIEQGQGWNINLNDFITDDGGAAPSFSIAAGALPDGITLNPNGTFSGTATTPDSGSVTFTATNSGGSSDSNNASWTVTLVIVAPTWGTVVLPTVDVGQGWSTDLNTFITNDGGDPNITFTVASGALPAGITLNPNGTFSGTATTANNSGVTFLASNNGGNSVSNNAAWTVNPLAPTWGTVTLPTIGVGDNWSGINLNDFITDDGGETPTFSIASGGLPAGISLVSNGTFTGTATAGGSGSVTFAATNSGGSSNSNAAGWTVIGLPVWSTVILPTVSEGQGWNTDLNTFITDDGGQTPNFTLFAGVLPDGITLNLNGTFSGVASPASSGSNTATFRATNLAGSSNSNAASWTVIDVPLDPVVPLAGWTGLENCA